ncbi:MAG: RES domain-containing protein [Gammaproteobacteria bacterium]|nr:MAG: RES domain-containing protein [Gammaproteobacteria bacterium]TND01606.1 MAG: RES domain-containing protein [Gammaproteobacteria bacterium]
MASRRKPPPSATPLAAYRIADSRFPLFDGRGAMLEGGRWNSPGYPVIYASLSQSCAMLEILAQTNIGKVPKHHKLIKIEIPANLNVETVSLTALPGWNHRNQGVSRAFGDTWLTSKRSVALIVPSVIALHDRNLIINPLHPEFSQITSSAPEDIQWDERLFKNPKKGVSGFSG